MTLHFKEEFKHVEEWVFTNIYDFIQNFEDAEQYFRDKYPLWTDKDYDILDFVGTDQEGIEEYLESLEDSYTYIYEDDYNGGTFTIFKIEKPIDYKKGFEILMEYFDSIADEEKEEVDKQLKEVGL